MNIKKVILSMLFVSVVCSSVSYPMTLPTTGKQVAHTWTQWLLDRPMTINPYGIYDWCSNHAFLTSGLAICSVLAAVVGYHKYRDYCHEYADNAKRLMNAIHEILRNQRFTSSDQEENLILRAKSTTNAVKQDVIDFCKAIKKDSSVGEKAELIAPKIHFKLFSGGW